MQDSGDSFIEWAEGCGAGVQVKHERAGVEPRVRDDGASGRSGVSGSHPFGWRDAMDLLVKWRQLAEPNDQVGLWALSRVFGP